MTDTQWLPDLVMLEAHEGDWSQYLAVVYDWFRRDFLQTQPRYGDKLVLPADIGVTNGKERTFWHLISEGEVEGERTPDLRRCERIRWPRPIIEHHSDAVVRVWEGRKKASGRTRKRIYLWLEEQEYLVVLGREGQRVILVTAFLAQQAHAKRRLMREFEEATHLCEKG